MIIYIISSILLQLLVEVRSKERYAHTATYIDDKLYILGGAIPLVNRSIRPYILSEAIPPDNCTSPNYFLDFSIPFNTHELNWFNLSNNNYSGVLPHLLAAAIKGGANNRTLFLYGGSANQMEIVYTFDTQSNKWGTPTIGGILSPGRKKGITPIIDYNGLIYLFGGNFGPFTYVNNMYSLDSTKLQLNWTALNSFYAPSPRAQYGAVFLPNKKIIYMGMYYYYCESFINLINYSLYCYYN
jgi:hypothetical protein